MANKIKLDLAGLTVPQKFALIRQVVIKLTGNANFPSPNPSLAALTALANELEASYLKQQTDQQTSKTSTTALHTKETAANAGLNSLSNHVEEVSGGNQEKIESSGLDVRAPKTTTTSLDTPTDLSVTAGDNDGELDLGWNPVANKSNYEVQISDDPPTADSWKFAKTVTASKTTLTGLGSGTKKWVRVRTHGAKELVSPWSDPAARRVP